MMTKKEDIGMYLYAYEEDKKVLLILLSSLPMLAIIRL
jgi:hypothetical protein